MKVKELIEQLKKLDPDRIVIMSRDSEGNTFCPIDELSTSAYRAEYRDIGLEKLTPEDIKNGHNEESVMTDGEKAVVLWPEN